MNDAESSDKNELVESDQINYGSTSEDNISTQSLEEIYTIIGKSFLRVALIVPRPLAIYPANDSSPGI